MKLLPATGIILTLALFLFSTGLADVASDENTVSEKPWAGTWTDGNYSLSIEQNGTEITGIGHSFDMGLYDPFLLSGTISEDGTKITGIMKDSGTLEMDLSDDQMSFTANGTADSVDTISEPYAYSTEATRNGTIIAPDSVWSGNWLTKNTSLYFNQNGNYVTGEYFPFESPEVRGVIEGSVSEDGKTLSTVWSSVEEVTFVLSDDGMYLIESDCGEEEIDDGGYCLNLTKTM